VFAAGTLLFGGSASAQFGGQVKVSDVIEGGVGGVSTARCGNTVVVGFADVEKNNPNSYDGMAVSKSGGQSFTDRGTLPVRPPDPSLGTYVLGSNSANSIGPSNPAVACANSNLFYYASIYHTPGGICSFVSCTAISVSTSKDGGAAWGLPIVASVQGEDVFEFLSPSMAVDPTNSMRLYVAYINWSLGNDPFPDCFEDIYSVDVVESSDGGKTWSLPAHIDHACNGGGNDPTLTGTMGSPNITVSPDGNVYVTDQFVGQSGNPNAIHFLRSLDHGNSFSTPLIASTQATTNPLPQLAVDRTGSGSRGEIYLTWSGSQTGTYTDTLVSESLDGGASFSFPRPVSSAPSGGSGRFQSNPVIAVDNDGQIQECFYETPTNQPTNSSVYSYNCATSLNQAITWQVAPITGAAPVGYDAVAADFLVQNDGFFTAFELTGAGQQHVVGEKSDLN
jgi:hypothetical protein